jgi:hypothetical protein
MGVQFRRPAVAVVVARAAASRSPVRAVVAAKVPAEPPVVARQRPHCEVVVPDSQVTVDPAPAAVYPDMEEALCS